MKTTFIAILALAYASSEFWETYYKTQCNQVNYMILSADNPNDYPAISMDIDNISQNGADCKMTENKWEQVTILDCDCSDAENYNFVDQAVCEKFENPYEKHTDKLISLTCDHLGKKAMCNHANYIVFSVMRKNPGYPAIPNSPDSIRQVGYDGSDCTVIGESGKYRETFYDCYCTDSDNYDFFDKDLCDMLKNQSAPEDEKYAEGLDKIKNLTCGNDVTVTSVSMILFTMVALLKY